MPTQVADNAALDIISHLKAENELLKTELQFKKDKYQNKPGTKKRPEKEKRSKQRERLMMLLKKHCQAA
jgi:hypothetical protein